MTIVGGQTATVTFNNTLKRGSLEVVKSSEDNFVEGVTFHLYGTSLSGDEVDAYAVTDENGVAVLTMSLSVAILLMSLRKWIRRSAMWSRRYRMCLFSGMR